MSSLDPTRLDTEYAPLTRGAVLLDLSDRSLLELTGRDRASFLHNFCTNDIKRLPPGGGCEAFLTSIKGRILEHLFVFADADSLWVDGTPGYEDPVRSHLDRYLITEDVQIAPRSAERGLLWLAGPAAADQLRAITGVDAASFSRLQHAWGAIEGERVHIRRLDLGGVPGWQVGVPRAQLADVSARFEQAGAVRGSSELYDALRIESGLPRYGRDLTEENLAQEARRTPVAISFTKGCYLGQEPIARIDALGHVNRELCILEGERQPGAEVTSLAGEAAPPVVGPGGQVAGELTSRAWHPRTKSWWGLAVLKRGASGEGTRVTAGAENVPMTVHAPLPAAS